jgi:hypothetical protein
VSLVEVEVDLRNLEAQVSSFSLSRSCSTDMTEERHLNQTGAYKTRNNGMMSCNGFLKYSRTNGRETVRRLVVMCT